MKIIHVMDKFYSCTLTPNLRESLNDTPVALLCGARQTGKTTLVAELYDAPLISLDDAAILAAARNDATGFLAGLEANTAESSTPIILDEVQYAPELFPAIKLLVDRARRQKIRANGRFLLTGSANVLLLPKVSESLAGRMEVLQLWPLSQSEIEGATGTFVDAVFESEFAISLPETRNLSCTLG